MVFNEIKRQLAFTIVELLVVIVVIGVLATMVTVSYSGVSQRAISSSIRAELNNFSKILKSDEIINGSYPVSLEIANNSNGIISKNYQLRYFVNDNLYPTDYCLEASKDETIFSIRSNFEFYQGDCNNYELSLILNASDNLSYPGSGTLWSDLSGLNNSFTLNNEVSYDGSLVFDGIDDYAINTANFIVSPSKLTIEAWILKTHDNATYNCALHKGPDTSIGSSEYWMGFSNTGLLTATIGARTGVGWSAGSTSVVASLNKWYHLVATWNGSTVRVFVDGVFKKQYSLISYSNLNVPTRVGASSNGANYQFPGKISRINIYKRALPDDEIINIFNAQKDQYGL